jgi:phenylacetate-coenzyme A ligase PaaK-like adenylate-forming protein
VLTKARLMSEYDNVVTDRAIRLEDVRQHMLNGDASRLFRGRYLVTATGGSTGQPAIVLHDRDEWLWVMASYARAADWAGIGFSLSSRRRHAVVSSRTPWHQSSQLARTAEGPWVPTLRLDAGDPLDRILKALNDFQPHVLTAYAKTARVLAESTLAGDLRISPESVVCASEPLSRETRQRIVEAWGVQPFDIYGATETAGIAAECEHHAGLHLLRLSMTRTGPCRLWSLGPRCWSPCCSAVHCR